MELCIVEKYLNSLSSRGQGGIGSEPYEKKNIKETWFKETVLNYFALNRPFSMFL